MLLRESRDCTRFLSETQKKGDTSVKKVQHSPSIILMLGWIILVSIITQSISSVFFSKSIVYILTSLITYFFGYGISIYAYFRENGWPDMRNIFTFKFKAKYGLAILLGTLLLLLTSYITHLFSGSHAEGSASIILQSSTLIKLLWVLNSCIIAPIFEEVLYRGIISGYYKNNGIIYSPNVIISIALFSIMHGTINYLPFYALISIINTYLLFSSKSIIYSIIQHSIINSIMMFFLLV